VNSSNIQGQFQSEMVESEGQFQCELIQELRSLSKNKFTLSM